MTKIIVELVKYDTEKTTKRKRANLLIEEKSEKAVIERLEKIHKGDKVKKIHEIVWGEEKTSDEKVSVIITGKIKFFNEEKGFGFIHPDDDMDDIFFHASSLDGQIVDAEDCVQFETNEGPKGTMALHIKLVD